MRTCFVVSKPFIQLVLITTKIIVSTWSTPPLHRKLNDLLLLYCSLVTLELLLQMTQLKQLTSTANVDYILWLLLWGCMSDIHSVYPSQLAYPHDQPLIERGIESSLRLYQISIWCLNLNSWKIQIKEYTYNKSFEYIPDFHNLQNNRMTLNELIWPLNVIPTSEMNSAPQKMGRNMRHTYILGSIFDIWNI